MRIVVYVDPRDFVTDEELDPLQAALKDVAESHVGHLADPIDVEVRHA